MICFRMFPIGEKFVHKRGRKYQLSPLNVFCPTVPKQFVEEPFSVSLISVIEKPYAKEWNITIFYEIFFFSQCRKLSWKYFSV